MSSRLDKSWTVLASHEAGNADRCVDVPPVGRLGPAYCPTELAELADFVLRISS
jgi:hypothetical protein